MANSKGMALPIETIILLLIAVIVLAAVLSFFLGVFNPSIGKTDIMRKQTSLCSQIFAADPTCNVARVPQNLVSDLNSNVCNRPSDSPVCSGTPGQDCVRKCCSIFCPPA